jgi:hypothetical protein
MVVIAQIAARRGSHVPKQRAACAVLPPASYKREDESLEPARAIRVSASLQCKNPRTRMLAHKRDDADRG